MTLIKYVFMWLTLFSLLGCQTLLMTSMKPRTTFLSGKKVSPVSFSPDGSEIVFSAGDENGKTSHIYKVKVDGTGIVALTTSDSYDYGPVYSPDGTKILFSSITDGKQGDLYLMNADGSEKVAITGGNDNDFSPIFSPDDKKVFFVRAEWFGNYSPIALPSWHVMDIFSVNIDGTDLRRVTYNRAYRMGNLSIHPDGHTLMIRMNEYKSPFSVWILSVSAIDQELPPEMKPVRPEIEVSKPLIPLFGSSSLKYDELFNPEFSPDGSAILFTGDREYNQIYIMDLKTNKARRITNIEKHGVAQSIYDPLFSMDGAHIAFKTIGYSDIGFFKSRIEPVLWVVNNDGSGLRVIEIKEPASIQEFKK